MKSLFIILSFCLSLCSQAQQRQWLTPQDKADYAQGVSGHSAAFLNNRLIMAGGCNFPEKPVHEGGKKRFYADIYVGRLDSLSLTWQHAGQLSRPTAYGTGILYKSQLIIAGGETPEGDAAEVYALTLDRKGRLRIQQLPSLPQPRSGMAAAVLGSELFLIGGRENGQLTTSVIALDLENPTNGWTHKGHYPGRARLKVLAHPIALDKNTSQGSSTAHSLLLVASFSGMDGRTPDIVTDMCAYIYTPDNKEKPWHAVELPGDSLLRDATFGGGAAFAGHGSQVLLTGGVNRTRFVPALRRGKQIAALSDSPEDGILRTRLQQESRAYLLHDPSWYAFTSHVLCYDPHTDAWSVAGDSPSHARADAVVTHTPLGFIIIGGEAKPGVRTPAIHLLNIQPPKGN